MLQTRAQLASRHDKKIGFFKISVENRKWI